MYKIVVFNKLKRKKIDFLKEYKKSVIYEAVTGKTIID